MMMRKMMMMVREVETSREMECGWMKEESVRAQASTPLAAEE